MHMTLKPGLLALLCFSVGAHHADDGRTTDLLPGVRAARGHAHPFDVNVSHPAHAISVDSHHAEHGSLSCMWFRSPEKVSVGGHHAESGHAHPADMNVSHPAHATSVDSHHADHGSHPCVCFRVPESISVGGHHAESGATAHALLGARATSVDSHHAVHSMLSCSPFQILIPIDSMHSGDVIPWRCDPRRSFQCYENGHIDWGRRFCNLQKRPRQSSKRFERRMRSCLKTIVE